MAHFIDRLLARPLTLENPATGVLQRNERTTIAESPREARGELAAQLLDGEDFAQHPDLRGLTLPVAGVRYLLLRSRETRIFGSIDLRSDVSWDELKAPLRSVAQRLFTPA